VRILLESLLERVEDLFLDTEESDFSRYYAKRDEEQNNNE